MYKVNVLNEYILVRNIFNILGEKGFPNLMNRIYSVAKNFRKDWIRAVKNCNTKEGWKKPYADSIKISVNASRKEISISAPETNLFVNLVEKGRIEFDIKEGLLKSPKAKVSKKGVKYMTIFMRKKVRELPEEIYEEAKKLSYFKVVGVYDPKDLEKLYRFNLQSGSGTALSSENPKYDRLVKIAQKGHTVYGTFRTITKNTPGFISPYVPGTNIFQTTAREKMPAIEAELKKALEQDLKLVEGMIR